MDLARCEGGDGMPGIREEEMMAARKPRDDTHAMSRHVINGVPMDGSKWRRLLEWCEANDTKVGVVAGKELEKMMRRRGI